MRHILRHIHDIVGDIVMWGSLVSMIGGWLNIAAVLSLLVAGPKIDAPTLKIILKFVLLCFILGVMSMIGLVLWLFSVLLRGVSNAVVDYKVICKKFPLRFQGLEKELNDKDIASPHVNGVEASFCRELTEQGFFDLLNSPDTECVNVKSISKKGKTILQCSFIPVDADGNTIIVRRNRQNHISILNKINNWFKTVNAFISFSPIPDGHNRKFESIANCYAHEVPDDGVRLKDLDFQFVGVIYNRRGGACRHSEAAKKMRGMIRADLHECIRYLFAVYIVKYSQCHFVSKGKPNWKDIDLAFAQKDRRGSRREDRYFLKDHDCIVGADSVIDIGSRLKQHGNPEREYWMKVEQSALRRVAEMVASDLNDRQ